MTEQAEIARRIECAAATDWLNSCLNAPPDVAQSTGLEVHKFGAAFAVIMPRQKEYPVNGANAVGIFEPVTEALLDDLAAFFQARKCGFGVSVNPVSRPETLLSWLMQRGYRQGGRVPLLYRRAADAPPAPPEIRIARVDATQAETWKDIFGRWYVPYLRDWMASFIGRPDRFHYLAFCGDALAAASQMSVTDGVGCLHFTNVLPEFRGRGIQRALIARRIQDAAAIGCDWVTSTADENTLAEPGYSMRNLLTCGFQLLHYSQGYDAPSVSIGENDG